MASFAPAEKKEGGSRPRAGPSHGWLQRAADPVKRAFGSPLVQAAPECAACGPTGSAPCPACAGGAQLLQRQVLGNGSRGATIQAKLTVGEPNDPYEQEADRVAEQVMRMAAPSKPTNHWVPGEEMPEGIQPKPLAGAITSVAQRQDINLLPVPISNRSTEAGKGASTSSDSATPAVQASPAAAAIAGAGVLAAAACAYGHYNYAMDNFRDKDDKFKHCWTSCKIATWCGGDAISALMGLSKEAIDKVCDYYGGACKAELGDIVADAEGIACSNVPLISCVSCCEEARSFHAEADRTGEREEGLAQAMFRSHSSHTRKPKLAFSKDISIQAKSEACEERGQPHRSSPAMLQLQPDIESQLNANKGGGSPLPDPVRSFMEPRFEADFSQVRVHTGSESVQMNQDLNAQAFTHRQDVYFGAGKAPAKDALTAHELTHVVQQTGGVQAQLDIQRWPWSTDTPSPATAAASGDPDKVSDVPVEAWSTAKNSDRRRAVMVLLSKKTMFPWNDTTVVRILNSYPDRDSMEASDIAAVKAAAERGSIKGLELTGYWDLVRGFEREVVQRARENVDKNLTKLDEMSKKYGIGREVQGAASGIPSAMDNLQMAAARVADARHFQFELRKIQVGWKPMDGSAGLLPSGNPLYFDPTQEPKDAAAGGYRISDEDAVKQGIRPYSQVKSTYEQLEIQIGKIMSANSALYLLAATPALDQRVMPDDDRLHFGRSALGGFDSTSPQQARKELENAYQRATENLRKIKVKLGEDESSNTIDVASLDAVGLRVAQTPKYSTPFARWAATNAVETAKTRKEEISNFIDFATAVIFIGAVIGTMGGAAAAAALLTGVGSVGAVASAGVKFSNAADLQSTADAGIRPEDKLTSPAKVDAADLEAAIAGAVALLSAIAAAKGLKGLLGFAFRRTSSVAEELANLNKLSPARASKVVQQSIKEVGPLQTAKTAGIDVEDLFKYLEHGTDEYKAALELAIKLRETSQKVIAGAVNFKGRPVSPTYQNWKGWHGNNISPRELQASGGFKAAGTNTDLYEHIIEKGEPSAFRGTTANPLDPTGRGGAAHWGKYVYEIEAGEAWDTSQIWETNQNVLSGSHPLPGEYEIAIRGEVPWERIKGWHVVDEGVGPAGVTREKLKLGGYVRRVDWEAAQTAPKK